MVGSRLFLNVREQLLHPNAFPGGSTHFELGTLSQEVPTLEFAERSTTKNHLTEDHLLSDFRDTVRISG